MEKPPSFIPSPNLKLMEQVRQVLRYYHYSYRTEQSYCNWIVRYLRFYSLSTHPKEMGRQEVERFLSSLATDKKVSRSTQRQALNALVFLYKNVLHLDLGTMSITRSHRGPKLPVVMTQEEVRAVINNIHGTHNLMARLLYGCGMRLMECHRLRLKDIDFGQGLVYIRDAKGGSERVVSLPQTLIKEISSQVQRAATLHVQDRENGLGDVFIPPALLRKYPHSSRELRWQYLFPSKKVSKDPQSGVIRRHHVMESGLQKAIKRAVKQAGILKRITSHTFRHSFATHLLESGVNIRLLQTLLGHKDVRTTEIYTHVMTKDCKQTASPLDSL